MKRNITQLGVLRIGSSKNFRLSMTLTPSEFILHVTRNKMTEIKDENYDRNLYFKGTLPYKKMQSTSDEKDNPINSGVPFIDNGSCLDFDFLHSEQVHFMLSLI